MVCRLLTIIALSYRLYYECDLTGFSFKWIEFGEVHWGKLEAILLYVALCWSGAGNKRFSKTISPPNLSAEFKFI